ncbi:MAG: DegT/DnrJ/EryC1/StrS family aminotransferase [Chlamydiia bacterium]|nr:DegT/DnrJ/EryC1/StrS family aminotransferase [Chlamydiia bacterium]
MTDFFPYGKQSINEQDCEQVLAALKQPIITRGELVHNFEEKLKATVGAEYCVVVNSGSTALEAAYYAAQGRVNDKVLTTPNSFIASCGPGIRRGMTPCFVDIDRATGNMDLEKTLLNLDYASSRGRLFVVPVHFGGIAMDMKPIREELRDPRAVIIEDAAHALGSKYPSGEKVGSCTYSDMTILSFHPVKNITTGEGGAITTNDPELYKRLLDFRNNGIQRTGQVWDYDVTAFTGNYNFTELQAALGLSQLERMEAFVDKRRALVKRYREKLKGCDKIRLFTDKQDDITAFHLMVIQTQMDRTPFMEKLREKGVGTQLHYLPLYRHTAVKEKVGDIAEYLPEMEAYAKTALSIPLYYDLTLQDVDHIADLLQQSL